MAVDLAKPAMFDLMPDSVCIVDPKGTLLDLNAAAALLVGSPRAALIGRTFDDALALVDDAGRSWWECERQARALRSVTRVPERRLTRGIGGPEVLLTARYVRGGKRGDRLERVLVVLRDGAARERLDRSNADLISTVAHELRAPLTSVKGFSAQMLTKWERFTDEQKRQMLEWINTDTDRVTRLLSELLDVSRIDSGRIEMHRQVVDLSAVIRRAFAGRIAAGEPADRFRLETHGDPPELWLDPDKVEQIVANLLENALRHGAGVVTVTVRAEPGGAVVDIDDEGEGVPEAIADRIFSKFFRGKAHRGGTGLGLYIVRGLIEAHGGAVSVTSAPGGGARFRFSVPAGVPTYHA